MTHPHLTRDAAARLARWLLGGLAAALVLAGTARAQQGDDFPVPPGYRLQILDPFDGRIAIPADWSYRMEPTSNTVAWIFSKEARLDGSYDTGLRVELFVGLWRTQSTRPRIAVLNRIDGLRRRGQVLSECGPDDNGPFIGQCIELLETVTENGQTQQIHTLHGAAYGKEMDLLLLTDFRAPAEQWAEAAPIAQVTSFIRVIGPRFKR